MASKANTGLIMIALLQACGSSANPGATVGASSVPPASGIAGSASSAAGAAGAASPVAPVVAAAGTTAVPAAGAAAPLQPVTPASATPTPAQPAAPLAPATPTAADAGVATNECGLHTQWLGDEYCILPPPPDKGFQIHIGPNDYDNPDAKFIMQPGAETVENIAETSGNSSDVYYYYRQYRMRPGTHHLILSTAGIGGKRLGGSQNLSHDNPENGVIAPENQGVGMKLAASTPLTVNMHYINLTEKPILKEAWVNVWYRDAKDVTEPANEMYSFAPINIPPGQHVLLHGTCPITGTGRLLSHYGHRHANNLRFSTWRERGTQKDLIYEDYNWEDPLTLEYSSIVTNMPADTATKSPGGWSGMLDLMPGDNISFECEIINMTNKTFTGQNEAENDEMCILIGDSVGTTVTNVCTYTTTQL
jgi:hypothetical protein